MATADGSEIRLNLHDTVLISGSLRQVQLGILARYDQTEVQLNFYVDLTHGRVNNRPKPKAPHGRFLSRTDTHGFTLDLDMASSLFRVDMGYKITNGRDEEQIYFYLVRTDKILGPKKPVPEKEQPTEPAPAEPRQIAKKPVPGLFLRISRLWM